MPSVEEQKEMRDRVCEVGHGARHVRHSNSADKWYCRKCEPDLGRRQAAARAAARKSEKEPKKADKEKLPPTKSLEEAKARAQEVRRQRGQRLHA